MKATPDAWPRPGVDLALRWAAAARPDLAWESDFSQTKARWGHGFDPGLILPLRMAVNHEFPATIFLPTPSADRLPMAPEDTPSLAPITDPGNRSPRRAANARRRPQTRWPGANNLNPRRTPAAVG